MRARASERTLVCACVRAGTCACSANPPYVVKDSVRTLYGLSGVSRLYSNNMERNQLEHLVQIRNDLITILHPQLTIDAQQ